MCWFIALGLACIFAVIAWYVTQFGGAALIKRDRAQHLAILNAARKRSGKPPLTEADLPPEPEDEAAKILPKGFVITASPPPRPAPADVADTVVAPPIPTATHAADVTADGTSAQSIALIEQGFHAFSQAGLQTQVERAWGVVFPKAEDAVEWVKYAGPPAPAVISCAGYVFTVENSPRRYDGFATGEPIGNAYRSVTIGPNDLPVENAYALLGKLAVELSSGSTAALYLPQFGERYAYTAATRDALLADDPVAALRGAEGGKRPPPLAPTARSAAMRERLEGHAHKAQAPHRAAPQQVLPVDEDFEAPSPVAPPAIPYAAPPNSPPAPKPDGPPGLAAAMREARRRFPEFEAAFRNYGLRSDPFLVKSAFSDGVHTEYMWSEVVEIAPTNIVAILRSAPAQVAGYKEGQNVLVPASDVADWIGYQEGPGGFTTIGNFTGPLLNG